MSTRDKALVLSRRVHENYRDCAEVAQAYLDLVPADDDEPADADWMSSIADEVHFHHWDFIRDGKSCQYLRLEFWREGDDDEQENPPWVAKAGDRDLVHISTRGQVRRLLKALQIHP